MISDFTITGHIVDLARSREGYRDGVGQNNRPWKRMSIKVNYWDQNADKNRNEYITIWNDNVDKIRNLAFEGQDIELVMRLRKKLNEKSGEWGWELFPARINLGWNQNTQQIPASNQVIPEPSPEFVKTVEQLEDDSILWD